MGLFEPGGIWIHAVGKTLLHSIWIGLLILALFRFTMACIPLRFSRQRHNIAVSTLLLLFISVITVFLILYKPGKQTSDLLPYHGIISTSMVKLPGINTNKAVYNPSLIFPLFTYLYLAGLLFMLFRSVASARYIRGLRMRSLKPDPHWQHRFIQIRKSLGILRKVDFLVSAHVTGPLLIGYVKPAIIVPLGMLSNLPVNQIETIILHELYHLKRRDYLVNIMQLFIERLLFYHPAVWIISGFIRSEREHCCDEGVLKATKNPVDYAKALLHLAEQQDFSRLAPGAVGSVKRQFSSRIKRILNHNTMKSNMRDKVLAMAFLAGSLIILLTISGFSNVPSFIRTDKMSSGLEAFPRESLGAIYADTVPQTKQEAELKEISEPELETLMEEVEEARKEALEEIEEIDWEAIREEMEETRSEALEEIEEIDWEAIREEMEEARSEALQEIEEIDWDAIREEMEEARLEIQEIDWEKVKADLELSFSEMKLDIEGLKSEIQRSMNEIDWDEIRKDIRVDLEKSWQFLDSIKIEMDL